MNSQLLLVNLEHFVPVVIVHITDTLAMLGKLPTFTIHLQNVFFGKIHLGQELIGTEENF